jgi:NAD(P)H-dependent nitrite reductase small subunit
LGHRYLTLSIFPIYKAEVVKDPARRAQFKQFVNTDETLPKDSMIEFVDIRGQERPADWPKDGQPQTLWKAPANDVFAKSEKSWVQVGSVKDFAPNVGSPILISNTQLAVFNNERRGEWFCTQNMCPHKQAFVLSQGIIGDSEGVQKVACPLHKKSFALEDGHEIGEGDLKILTFPVKILADKVFVELPAEPELDAILGTNGLRVQKSDCVDISGDALKVPSRAMLSRAGASATSTVLRASASTDSE